MASKAAIAETPTPEIHVLTRAEILAAQDRRHELVEVPAWGGWVTVWSMTGTDRDSYEGEIAAPAGDEIDYTNIRAKLVARSIGDEAGNRLFSEAEVAILGAKDADALERVAAVARRLSRLRKVDLAAARLELGKVHTGSPSTA